MKHDQKSSTQPAASSRPTGLNNDPVLALLRRHNIPLTRDNYLDLAYGDDRPAQLSAEQEMDLPPQIRLHLG